MFVQLLAVAIVAAAQINVPVLRSNNRRRIDPTEAQVVSVGAPSAASDGAVLANIVCVAPNIVYVANAFPVSDDQAVPRGTAIARERVFRTAAACSAACRSALASCCTAATVALDTCAEIAAMIRPVPTVGLVGR